MSAAAVVTAIALLSALLWYVMAPIWRAQITAMVGVFAYTSQVSGG